MGEIKACMIACIHACLIPYSSPSEVVGYNNIALELVAIQRGGQEWSVEANLHTRFTSDLPSLETKPYGNLRNRIMSTQHCISESPLPKIPFTVVECAYRRPPILLLVRRGPLHFPGKALRRSREKHLGKWG